MLTGLGFPSVINGVFWFVSALLIGSAVIYWLLLTYQNTFCKFGSLALALIIYAQIYQQIGYLDIVFDRGFLLTWGTWRGIAGLSLGCFLFYVKTNFQRLHAIPAWVITGAEIFLFIVTLAMMWRTRRDIKDFVMILVLSGLFLCIVSEKSRFSKMLNRPISGYLGKLSYAIYVNQVPFLLLFKNYCSAMHTNELAYWKAATVFLACVVAFSIITTELLGKLQPRVLRLKAD